MGVYGVGSSYLAFASRPCLDNKSAKGSIARLLSVVDLAFDVIENQSSSAHAYKVKGC